MAAKNGLPAGSPRHGLAVEHTVEPAAVRRPHLRRFRKSRSGVIGAGVLCLLTCVAIFAPVLAPYDPLAQVSAPLETPSASHLLGTDELGRDIVSRVIYGARISLEIASGSALIACAVGVPLGIVSGYLGRWIDAVAMRITDVLLALPGILLALVVVAILGSGTLNVMLAIAVSVMPSFARLARASTLGLRNEEFVLGARSMGASQFDIMSRTILPNVMGPIVVQIVVTAAVAVLAAAALAFLGLGTPPPAPSWGGMLQSSKAYLYQAPLYGLLPGLALALTIAALDGLGRGLQVLFGSDGLSRSRVGGMA